MFVGLELGLLLQGDGAAGRALLVGEPVADGRRAGHQFPLPGRGRRRERGEQVGFGVDVEAGRSSAWCRAARRHLPCFGSGGEERGRGVMELKQRGRRRRDRRSGARGFMHGRARRRAGPAAPPPCHFALNLPPPAPPRHTAIASSRSRPAEIHREPHRHQTRSPTRSSSRPGRGHPAKAGTARGLARRLPPTAAEERGGIAREVRRDG